MKWPRRASIPHMIPAEMAIRQAVDEVEKVGADVLLTDAVILLGHARDKVADYVDKLNPEGATIDIAIGDQVENTYRATPGPAISQADGFAMDHVEHTNC